MGNYAYLVDKNGMGTFYNLDIAIPILEGDEYLVYEDLQAARSMMKPRWTGTGWEEFATPEEMETKLLI